MFIGTTINGQKFFEMVMIIQGSVNYELLKTVHMTHDLQQFNW